MSPRPRIAFFGQSGPYGEVALRQFQSSEVRDCLVLVVEQVSHVRTARRRPLHPTGLLDAAAGSISVVQTPDVNDASTVALVRAARPDLLLCVGFERLFVPALLAVAPGWNLHPSLLPRYRGPSPLFWMYRQREPEAFGVTLHEMDARADRGAILLQEPLQCAGDAAAHYGVAARSGVGLVAHALEVPPRAVQQDPRAASYAPRPRPEDAEVLPHEWNGAALGRFVDVAAGQRAAWMRLGHDTFFLRRALGCSPGRVPGHYALAGDQLTVQCSDGLATFQIQA
jgi:methionyl-tRNA formyltransferase